MEKRISSRGIIIEDEHIYAMFRRKKKDNGLFKEYYVIPGGGINEDEDLIEGVTREINEEFSIKVKVLGYLGKDENDDTIAHFFHCEITEGIPTLGGEELDRCNEDNYYEIKTLNIKDLENIDINGKEMILKAFNNEYTKIKY